jgi:hypothetical protein
VIDEFDLTTIAGLLDSKPLILKTNGFNELPTTRRLNLV